MKQITKVRKSVCAMANQLRKAGYSLKEAFKKAWQRGKLSMTIRAAGTTFENRQERLQFLQQFKPEDLTVTICRGCFRAAVIRAGLKVSMSALFIPAV